MRGQDARNHAGGAHDTEVGMMARRLVASCRATALALVAAAGVYTGPEELRAQAAPATQARGITSADLHRLRSVGDVQLSPDGRLIAHTVQDRARPGRPSSRIWIVDAAGGEPRPLADGEESSASPLWSPDGRWIAYEEWRCSDDGLLSGIEIIDPEGRYRFTISNDQYPWADHGRGQSSAVWSPDSLSLAFIDDQSFSGESFLATARLLATATRTDFRFDYQQLRGDVWSAPAWQRLPRPHN